MDYYTIGDLMTEYDVKLKRLNGISSSTRGEIDLADSAIAMGMIKDFENLLLCTLLLIKTPKGEGQKWFTLGQEAVLKQTIERCEALIEILQETMKNSNSSNNDPSSSEEDRHYNSRFINLPEDCLKISPLGKGRYVFAWNMEIDLADAQLEEEEQDLLAMANTPIPSESHNFETTETTTSKLSSLTRKHLIAAWSETQYHDAMDQCRSSPA